MTDSVFIDTNIFVYAVDTSEPQKNRTAKTTIECLARDHEVTLSTQVLQEFFTAATRKLAEPLPHEDAREATETLAAYRLAPIDPQTVLAAIDRVKQASLSFWDALIVETALAAGCTRLVTEDLQHGQVFDGRLTVEDPFRKPTEG